MGLLAGTTENPNRWNQWMHSRVKCLLWPCGCAFFLKLEQVWYLISKHQLNLQTFHGFLCGFHSWFPALPLLLLCTHTCARSTSSYHSVWRRSRKNWSKRISQSRQLRSPSLPMWVVSGQQPGTRGWFGVILNSNPSCEYALGNPAAEYVRGAYNHDIHSIDTCIIVANNGVNPEWNAVLFTSTSC